MEKPEQKSTDNVNLGKIPEEIKQILSPENICKAVQKYNESSAITFFPVPATKENTYTSVEYTLEEHNEAFCSIGCGYEDRYLTRPFAIEGRMTRPCICGNACLGNTIKIHNRPPELTCFVLSEFLVPQDEERLRKFGHYPSTQQMCVLCTRKMVMSCSIHLSSNISAMKNVIVNSYQNICNENDGYQESMCFPQKCGGRESGQWTGIIGRVCANDANAYYFEKKTLNNESTPCWYINQDALKYTNATNSGTHSNASDVNRTSLTCIDLCLSHEMWTQMRTDPTGACRGFAYDVANRFFSKIYPDDVVDLLNDGGTYELVCNYSDTHENVSLALNRARLKWIQEYYKHFETYMVMRYISMCLDRMYKERAAGVDLSFAIDLHPDEFIHYIKVQHFPQSVSKLIDLDDIICGHFAASLLDERQFKPRLCTKHVCSLLKNFKPYWNKRCIEIIYNSLMIVFRTMSAEFDMTPFKIVEYINFFKRCESNLFFEHNMNKYTSFVIVAAMNLMYANISVHSYEFDSYKTRVFDAACGLVMEGIAKHVGDVDFPKSIFMDEDYISKLDNFIKGPIKSAKGRKKGKTSTSPSAHSLAELCKLAYSGIEKRKKQLIKMSLSPPDLSIDYSNKTQISGSRTSWSLDGLVSATQTSLIDLHISDNFDLVNNAVHYLQNSHFMYSHDLIRLPYIFTSAQSEAVKRRFCEDHECDVSDVAPSNAYMEKTCSIMTCMSCHKIKNMCQNSTKSKRKRSVGNASNGTDYGYYNVAIDPYTLNDYVCCARPECSMQSCMHKQLLYMDQVSYIMTTPNDAYMVSPCCGIVMSLSDIVYTTSQNSMQLCCYFCQSRKTAPPAPDPFQCAYCMRGFKRKKSNVYVECELLDENGVHKTYYFCRKTHFHEDILSGTWTLQQALEYISKKPYKYKRRKTST